MQHQPIADVLDALELLRRGTPDHRVNLAPRAEQQLSHVRAVLSRDPRYQRAPNSGHSYTNCLSATILDAIATNTPRPPLQICR
jgi:hypothetical protein